MALDHEMIQGDTVALDFSIIDDEGSPIDLTGVTSIRWHMARSVYSEPTVEKELGDGIEITDEDGGLLTVMLDPIDTIAVVGTFYHEIEIIDSEGNVTTPRTGQISVLPGLIG